MACSKRSYDETDSSDNEVNLQKRPRAAMDLEDLKCRICLQLPKGGMYLCSNGHSVCSDCISKLTNCHTCRVRYPNGPARKRNHFLDDVLSKMRFDCVWRKDGCDLKGLSHQQLTEHEKGCNFNPTPVPLCRLLLFKSCDYKTSPKFLAIPNLDIPASYLEHLKTAHCENAEIFCENLAGWKQCRSCLESQLEKKSSLIDVEGIMNLNDNPESGNYIGSFTIIRYVDMSQADVNISWFVVRFNDTPQSATVRVKMTLKGDSTGGKKEDGPGAKTSWNATVMSFHEYYQFVKKPSHEREKMKFSMPWSRVQEYYLNKKENITIRSAFTVKDVDKDEGEDSSSGDSD